MRKEGAAFDLSIALGMLSASEQISGAIVENTMVLGELNLAGDVRPVRGVLSAVGAGLKKGITCFVVPEENRFEAEALGKGRIVGVTSLTEAVYTLTVLHHGKKIEKKPHQHRLKIHTTETVPRSLYHPGEYGDLSDIKGHWILKRAVEVAAAGRHNLFLFGPPGSGKSMVV